MNIRFRYRYWLVVFLGVACTGMRADKKDLVKSRKPIQRGIPTLGSAQKPEALDDQVKTSSFDSFRTRALRRAPSHSSYAPSETAAISHEIEVRVLLDESITVPSWSLHSESGFLLLDPLDPKKSIVIHAKCISVSSRSGYVYIENKRLTRHCVMVRALDGHITYNNHEYGGSFYVACTSDRTLLINCVGLEDYVASVLYYESWPGWPHEMHKVMAVAIRSYGVSMMVQAMACKRLYHVRNSVKHQVYGGLHKQSALYDAVTETRGVIMSYQDQPVIAMYDSCCGGVVTARMRGIDFVKAPYLARKTPCTFCRNCKIFSWTAEFEKSELTELLKGDIPKLSRVKSITISKRDAAGLVQQVSVKSARGVAIVSGKRIFSLKPKVKSCYYMVENTPDKIIFRGKGYGHHVGLCQWGACQMIKDGYDYKKTLRFYYPGVSFVKIV
jgi:stage II sporulation protein D